MSDTATAEQISHALGLLEAGRIDDLNIDVAHNRITVQVSFVRSSSEELHTTIFDGVASFYVVLGAKERRFEPLRQDRFPGDTLVGECDGIDYFPDGIGRVDFNAIPGTFVSTWATEFSTRPNFLLTSGDTIFLIEARKVIVDDRPFDVGYVFDAP